MPTLTLQPTRTEVTRTFPVLGFVIRTGESPSWFEVALATDASLFAGESRPRRTVRNFYSTRVQGPLPTERGEAVYMVPQAVLDRFAGQARIYYAIAAYSQPEFHSARVLAPPAQAAPFVSVSRSFTGSSRRLSIKPAVGPGLTGDGSYLTTKPESLTWGGDEAMPGKVEPASPPASAPAVKPDTKAASLDVAYDDGYGEMPAVDDTSSADDDGPGIAGPEPDEGSLAASLAGETPDYSGASRFVPAAPGNFRAAKSPRAIRRIVIHITDGGKKISGTVAWFKDPKAGVSAHYIVGQDGEVVQMVREKDVAWHAHTANGDSIGIEHVANSKGLMPTEAEYCASAALVNSLCTKYGLPMDRDHIMGHSEADPKTTHTDCPNAVWDWDYYMALVTSGTCFPRDQLQQPSAPGDYPTPSTDTQVASLGAGDGAVGMVKESFYLNWEDVPLLAQTEDKNCWAAAATMVADWAEQKSHRIASANAASTIEEAAALYGLHVEPPQSRGVDSFRELLETTGPQWVSADQDFSGTTGFHAVVVTGMYSDGAPDGSDTYLIINDPWDRDPGVDGHPGPHTGTHKKGSTYSVSWAQFIKEFESAAASEPGWLWVRLMHANDVGSRKPARSAQVGAATSMANAAEATGNEGGIEYDLAKQTQPKYPNDDRRLEGAGDYTESALRLVGPAVSGTYGSEFANLEVRWRHNGSSIKEAEIRPDKSQTMPGARLKVKATIADVPETKKRPDGDGVMAALRVLTSYDFSIGGQSNIAKQNELTLYGDGSYDIKYWTAA